MVVIERLAQSHYAEAFELEEKQKLCARIGLSHPVDKLLFVQLLARGFAQFYFDQVFDEVPDLAVKVISSKNSPRWLQNIAWKLAPNLHIVDRVFAELQQNTHKYKLENYPLTDSKANYFAALVDFSAEDLRRKSIRCDVSGGRRFVNSDLIADKWGESWYRSIERSYAGSMDIRDGVGRISKIDDAFQQMKCDGVSCGFVSEVFV